METNNTAKEFHTKKNEELTRTILNFISASSLRKPVRDKMYHGTFHHPQAVRLIYCSFKAWVRTHNATFSQAAVLSAAMTFFKSHQ